MRLGGTEGTRTFHPIDDERPVLGLSRASVVYRAGPLSIGRDQGFVAVDEVSLEIPRGLSLGVVGESGCGKTSLARSIVDLAPLTSGEISIGERTPITGSRLRKSRRLAQSVQMVFQDPFSSLNPRQRVLDAVGEPLVIHRRCRRSELPERVVGLLERVGLSEAHAHQYPHQLSGGQRQRVCIARSLAVEPSLLVCDEPTSALDVSIQAQVVRVFQELEREEDLTYLFITHDLALLPQLTEFVAVMYLGRIVETGPVQQVLSEPSHPYTHALVAAAPVLGRARTTAARSRVIEGDATSPEETTGCRFRERCWLHARLDPAEARLCVEDDPGSVAARHDAPQHSACHYPELVTEHAVELGRGST